MIATPRLPNPLLKLGIEHAFVFADEVGRYLDGENAPFTLFSAIVEQLPAYEGHGKPERQQQDMQTNND